MIIAGILLIGGQGSRFNPSLPKQFHWLAGKRLYLYALEQFIKIEDFTSIILVAPKDWISIVQEDLKCYSDSRIRVIVGGDTRQASSRSALNACLPHTDYVVIHDGVRPFVSSALLRSNIATVIEHGAVDTCIPSCDTVVHMPASHQIATIPPRAEYWRGQTPQSFHYPLIVAAHARAEACGIANATDDCALVLALNHPVRVVLGSEENIKITTELDLFLAEQILRSHRISQANSNASTSLTGKKIAVIGGTGGIGTAIVNQLREEGALVFPISRHTSPYRVDCTSPDQIQALFEQLARDHGPLDGLINAFGQLTIKPLSNLLPCEIEHLVGSNYTGFIFCCKWATLHPQGHIINIASSSYMRGKQNYAVYSSAKAAVVNLTQGLAEERPDLCINTLIPSRTNTPMRQHNFPGENIAELLDPQEVATAVIQILKTGGVSGATVEIRRTKNPCTKSQFLETISP